MNILVVDDEILQLKSIKIGLRTEGYSVVTALNGKEALQQLQEAPTPFDLMITDYFMPDINGLELLQEVRRIMPFIPVILMTAYGRKDLVIEALKKECSGFIEKPFALDQLLGEIARVSRLKTHSKSSPARNESLAEIVHQINNPLMAIMGTAHVALHYQADPETLKCHLERIIHATEKITEINKHIIELDNSDRKRTIREKVEIHWLLEDCLNIFSGLITMQEIHLSKKFAALPLHVSGDIFELQQAFRNLILNAIEAMEGEKHKQLSVTADGDVSVPWVSIQIADTGCGVPPEFSKDFFNSTKTTKAKGSGLGLGVVRNVVARHGGRLNMSSREGHGTVITVHLPATAVTGEPHTPAVPERE